MPVRVVRGFQYRDDHPPRPSVPSQPLTDDFPDTISTTPLPTRATSPLPRFLPLHPEAYRGGGLVARLTCRLKAEHLWVLLNLDFTTHTASFLCRRCSRTLASDMTGSLLMDPPTASQTLGFDPDGPEDPAFIPAVDFH